MKLVRLSKFKKWLERETAKSRVQIEDRLSRIRDFGHFAVTLDDDGRVVILILGGNKNGQSKDIRQARKILAKYQE